MRRPVRLGVAMWYSPSCFSRGSFRRSSPGYGRGGRLVQQPFGEPFGAEDLGPLVEGQVSFHYDGSLLFDDRQVKSIQLSCGLGGRLPLKGSIHSCTKAAEMERPAVTPLLQTYRPVPTRTRVLPLPLPLMVMVMVMVITLSRCWRYSRQASFILFRSNSWSLHN